MSIQSDAAKAHIEKLLKEAYPTMESCPYVHSPTPKWVAEYRFCETRRWRFDYAVPSIGCAIELDGGLFIKGAHSNPASIRKNYEKMNEAARQGWRVWHYTPDQIIKAGRKTMPDEPILKELPWVEKTQKQETMV